VEGEAAPEKKGNATVAGSLLGGKKRKKDNLDSRVVRTHAGERKKKKKFAVGEKEGKAFFGRRITVGLGKRGAASRPNLWLH